MLASASAWRVLQAEHRRLRELWARVDAAMGVGDWRQASQRRKVEDLVLRFRTFDDATHRPKGVALIAALRGRSHRMDELLGRFESECAELDRLLSEALRFLAADEWGDPQAALCRSVLVQHGDLLRRHLDLEDAALRTEAIRLLGEDDWSKVVSSISKVIAASSARRTR